MAEITRRGVAIFGPNGTGKSTLTHALAQALGYFEMDAEDYYFPEQRAVRRHCMETGAPAGTEFSGNIPYSVSKSKAEAQRAMAADAEKHPEFVVCAVTVNWSDELLDKIGIAFCVRTPLEERLKRIERREVRRFGPRVLPGGDMYAQQAEFRRLVAGRSEADIDESAKRLHCPVVEMDGTADVRTNVKIMIEHIKSGA